MGAGLICPGRLSALTATFVSCLTLTILMVFIPYLLTKMQTIKTDLQLDLDEFNVLASEAWKGLQGYDSHRQHRKAASPMLNRYKRQGAGSTCSCDSGNLCEAGPPGQPGEPGNDGDPGRDGLNGESGLPGIAPPVELVSTGQCRVCPPGARGKSGPVGSKGPQGNKGRPGVPGNSGVSGRPGRRGPPGKNGNAGLPGKPGRVGGVGRPGNSGQKGESGTPGSSGRRGRKGSSGRSGPNGRPGPPGPNGPAGKVGEPGRPGYAGQEAVVGEPGPPGEDAQYCPCPIRGRLLQASAKRRPPTNVSDREKPTPSDPQRTGSSRKNDEAGKSVDVQITKSTSSNNNRATIERENDEGYGDIKFTSDEADKDDDDVSTTITPEFVVLAKKEEANNHQSESLDGQLPKEDIDLVGFDDLAEESFGDEAVLDSAKQQFSDQTKSGFSKSLKRKQVAGSLGNNVTSEHNASELSSSSSELFIGGTVGVDDSNDVVVDLQNSTASIDESQSVSISANNSIDEGEENELLLLNNDGLETNSTTASPPGSTAPVVVDLTEDSSPSSLSPPISINKSSQSTSLQPLTEIDESDFNTNSSQKEESSLKTTNSPNSASPTRGRPPLIEVVEIADSLSTTEEISIQFDVTLPPSTTTTTATPKTTSLEDVSSDGKNKRILSSNNNTKNSSNVSSSGGNFPETLLANDDADVVISQREDNEQEEEEETYGKDPFEPSKLLLLLPEADSSTAKDTPSASNKKSKIASKKKSSVALRKRENEEEDIRIESLADNIDEERY